jgi:20S proteasome alpha/beta subunit
MARQSDSTKGGSYSKDGALGGTTNIVMGNKNGLAAVTDSRLSRGGVRVTDHGEKKFLIDDHTLCVIAGSYSTPGTSLDKATFPA